MPNAASELVGRTQSSKACDTKPKSSWFTLVPARSASPKPLGLAAAHPAARAAAAASGTGAPQKAAGPHWKRYVSYRTVSRENGSLQNGSLPPVSLVPSGLRPNPGRSTRLCPAGLSPEPRRQAAHGAVPARVVRFQRTKLREATLEDQHLFHGARGF